MAHNAPGKHHREGISLKKLIGMFPNDDAARKWFESKLWPQGPYCPRCGSFNVQSNIKHKTMTHRCRDCKGQPMFSLKTGNIMEGSKLGFQTWAIAVYLVTVNLKGVSSMKLHRDLEITQKSAWFLSHRLRKAMEAGKPLFAGPVEVDETYFGGKRKNMPQAKRKALKGTGTGATGKTIVAGVKDRETNRVSAAIVPDTSTETLTAFVERRTDPEATVYSDEHSAYLGLDRPHEAVNHSAGEYVRDGDIHTQGIEAHWSMMKRGFHGTYHKMSPKHLPRYVAEFATRHNLREADTIAMMGAIAAGGAGKRLRYADLIADNGLSSGARSV